MILSSGRESMGIETDRFVDNLPQEVLCPLCCLILKEPVCSPCGHYVCAGCWQSWRRGPSADICPYCCTKILSTESVLRSQTVWKLVLNFNVYCPYFKDGCTAIYKLGLEDVHLKTCPYNRDNECERDYLSESELIEKRKVLNNCQNCQHTVENVQEHNCLSVLLETVKTQKVQITNLEYENDKLSLRLTSKENEIMDQLVDVENRCQKQALNYEREIRELRTKMAALQGELRKRAGEIEEVDISITLERQNGSLGLNIVGGYQEGKDSSGIFISRIAENGPASKPGKLLLNDRVLEVNGQDLRKATHEDAVQAFKNSHGVVHLLIRRNVAIDKRKWNMATQTDTSKSCELTDSAVMSCSEAEESLILVSENSKAGGPSKSDLYDSAYDTLLTQRSSRSHRTYSVDGSISPIVDDIQEPKDASSESCEDVRTITPSTVINGYGSTSSGTRAATTATRNGSMSTDDSLSPVHEVKMRRNNNDDNSSPRKVIRRSTYYLVDESINGSLSSIMNSLSEESKVSAENASTVTSTSNDLDIEYEYEYEEIMLKRTTQSFGIMVYYGGEEDDLGVYIGKVESGSPAEQSGRVMVGDQLIQINNTQIRSVEEATKILQENKEVRLLLARPVSEMQEQMTNGLKSNLAENQLNTLREGQNEIDLGSDTTEESTALEQIDTSSNEKAFSSESQIGSPCIVDKSQWPSSESNIDCNKNMENGTRKPEKKIEIKEDVKLTLKDYVLSRLRGHDKTKTKGIESDNSSSQNDVSKQRTLDRKNKKDSETDTPKSYKKEFHKDSLSRREKRENSSSNSPVRSSDCPTSSPNHVLLQNKPVRSAMRKESSRNKIPKHVRVDTKTDWTVTEKRVWEEFKIIQNMEAEEGKGQTGIEAEWKVRRSKDGKHIYIRKQSSKPNKSRFLKERAERLVAERTGITTDDDANTIYLGKFWNKEERKRQLLRHRLKREKLLERQVAKNSIPPNPMDSVMADIVQKRMTAPGHVFDDFLTVEEILTQRNKDGFLQGPIHVTTV